MDTKKIVQNRVYEQFPITPILNLKTFPKATSKVRFSPNISQHICNQNQTAPSSINQSRLLKHLKPRLIKIHRQAIVGLMRPSRNRNGTTVLVPFTCIFMIHLSWIYYTLWIVIVRRRSTALRWHSFCFCFFSVALSLIRGELGKRTSAMPRR